MSKIKIVVQHFNDCPNGPKMIENVKEAIKRIEYFIEYEEIIIDTNEKAKLYNFRGSPTLLINNKDFENMIEPLNPSLSCRYYNNGVPDAQSIKNKLMDILGKSNKDAGRF